MACNVNDKQAKIDELLTLLDKNGVPTRPYSKYFNDQLNKAKNEVSGQTSPSIPSKSAVKEDEHLDPITVALSKSNKYLSDAFITIGTAGASPTREGLIAFHDLMSANETLGPLYTDALDALTGTWASSQQVQAIRQYVMPDKKFVTVLNNLRSIKLASHQDQIETIRQTEEAVGSLFDEKFTEVADRQKAYKIFAEVGIFGLTANGMLNDLAIGAYSVGELIGQIESRLESPKTDKKIATHMAMLYNNEDLTGITVKANLEAEGYPQDSQRYKDMQALVALYGLNKIEGSAEMIQDVYQTPNDLYAGLMNLSIAAKNMSNRLASQVHVDGSRQYNTQKGNLIEDSGPTDWHLKAVSYDEAQNNPLLLEENGWKVLRPTTPTGGLGIYYRENTHAVRGGIATNVSYIKSGVGIPTEYYSDIDGKPTEDGIVTLSNKNSLFTRTNSQGYESPALTLTDEDRATLGYNQNPVSALVRAYAHNKMLLETQVIRDHVAESFTTKFSDTKDLSRKIGQLIEADNHPPLIDVGGDWSVEKYDALPKMVKDKYMLINKSILSDVGTLKNNAKLVRKDLGESILGYQGGNLFGDNHKANMLHKRTREFVRWFKINNIVLNAPKIAVDFAAGMSIASAKGASIQEMFSYGREALTGHTEIAEFRNKRTKYVFMRATKPEGSAEYQSLTKKIEGVDAEMLEHPFNPAYANGFIQSLGTQLIQEDGTSGQGLHATIEGTVRKYMIDKDGKSTALNEAIKKAANFGGPAFALDSLYGAVGDVIQNRGTQSEKTVLKNFQHHLERIKSQDDMSEYVAELMAAPNSSLVKLGGAATLMADMMPRWIIYRHNINEGMSEQAAVEDAIFSMLDYKEDLPSSLQFLSDLYILPYPSFFVRIQRVIANLAVHNPVSVSGQLLWEEYVGASTNIYGSNIVNKMSNGSLITGPDEIVTLPYAQLFGF